MVRRYGRCPIGQRLLAKTPHGHWRTTTFIAALRSDGLGAPMTLDGPMDGETFRAWTEQFLAPVLKPGDIVVMDNLPSHKVSGIREAIEAQNALLLYLPPPAFAGAGSTARTSIPSNKSSQSLKQLCERLQPAPSRSFGTKSPKRSKHSQQLNAPHTSNIAAMPTKWDML
jgi:hypothetical protein